jgi:hypothetical protein
MFAGCFTPKPAHTGAPTAQLRVVEAQQPKALEEALRKEDDATKTTTHANRRGHSGRSGSSFVRKLINSPERRSARRLNPNNCARFCLCFGILLNQPHTAHFLFLRALILQGAAARCGSCNHCFVAL